MPLGLRLSIIADTDASTDPDEGYRYLVGIYAITP